MRYIIACALALAAGFFSWDAFAEPANNSVPGYWSTSATDCGSQPVPCFVAYANTPVPVYNTTPPASQLGTAGITEVRSAALEATGCKVLKNGEALMWSAGVTNTDSSTDYLFIFDLTAAPSNGAVTPYLPPVQVAGNGGHAEWGADGDPPFHLTTGLTACLSSTGGLSFTAVASKGLFNGKVQ